MIKKFLIYIYLILQLTSCETKQEYYEAKVFSIPWGINTFVGLSTHSILEDFDRSLDIMHIETIRQKELLKGYSKIKENDFEACLKDCSSDFRLVILLFKSEYDQNPDTLSFGRIKKMVFNDKYYVFNDKLIKQTLAQIDTMHLRSYIENSPKDF